MDTIKRLLVIVIALITMGCSLPAGNAGGVEAKGNVDWEQTPFAFDGCHMYYKGKEFQLGWHIKEYEKVFGKYDRKWQSLNDVYTYDDGGFMLLSKVGRRGEVQKDTISQINIVFDFKYIELEEIILKKGMTDKMQIPENYARPRKFYTEKMLFDGVALQFGPQGVSIGEANSKMKGNGVSFDQSVMRSYWEHNVYCQPKINDSTIVYSLVLAKEAAWLQQLEISRSNSIF